jgi:single-stranded-DNA-specific exonuclease
MVPSARVSDVRTMGKEGKHARFSLHSGAHRALGVAFGRSSLGVGDDDPVDAAVRLEINHWNGSVEPRVVLRELYPLEDAPGAEVFSHSCNCEDAEWWRRFELELGRDLEASTPAVGASEPGGREIVRGASSATAAIAELVSSGAGVLAVCADAARRAALASGATGLARFNGGAARIACQRCSHADVAGLAVRGEGGLALTDYAALEAEPGLAAAFEHVVLVDPPRSVADKGRVSRPKDGAAPGFLHPLWTDAEHDFSVTVLDGQTASRPAIAAAFRALREAGEASGSRLREALAGGGAHPASAEAAARCFRVLAELGLLAGEPSGGDGTVGVVSSEGTDLERSAAFRAYRADHSEALQYLERRKQP